MFHQCRSRNMAMNTHPISLSHVTRFTCVPEKERWKMMFHSPFTTYPRLPVEIWEYIIDCISNYRPLLIKELCACTLVCRSWHARAKLHLYEDVQLNKDKDLFKFQTAVRKNPTLPLSSTKRVFISCKMRPISGFLTICKFNNLKSLAIHGLDLAREHLPVTAGPIFRTVTSLFLEAISACTVSNLLRFINSFHSLTELQVLCDTTKPICHKGGILSPPRSVPVPRLRYLTLWVAQGVGELIKWYIQEGYFLKSLEVLDLQFYVKNDQPSSMYRANVDSCSDLLRHCAGTLKDMTFGQNLPDGSLLVDEFANISKHLQTNNVSYTDYTPVLLSSFPNLRRMKWSGHSFQIAVAQLSLVCKPCEAIEVVDISIFKICDADWEQEKDRCNIIDKALASDNFPSLRYVIFYHTRVWEYFPILQSRSLLRVKG